MIDSNAGMPGRMECDVERVVEELRAIDHKSTWDRILEIGRVVFDGIARGDEVEWASHRGRKDVSLRKLVEHPACPFRRSALSNAVNVHLFVKAHPGVLKMPGLSPTHVALVTSLRNEKAMDLLERASAECWSGRDLCSHVRNLRKQAGERRGRPRSSSEHRAEVFGQRAIHALHQLQAEVSNCTDFESSSLNALGHLLDDIQDLVAETRLTLPSAHRKSGFPARPTHGRAGAAQAVTG